MNLMETIHSTELTNSNFIINVNNSTECDAHLPTTFELLFMQCMNLAKYFPFCFHDKMRRTGKRDLFENYNFVYSFNKFEWMLNRTEER